MTLSEKKWRRTSQLQRCLTSLKEWPRVLLSVFISKNLVNGMGERFFAILKTSMRSERFLLSSRDHRFNFVWAARHSLSPLAAWITTSVHQSLETPTETETQEHVYQKPVRDVNELKQHLIETWSATSRASYIVQVTDRWQDCFNMCLKAKNKHFVMLLYHCHDI